MFEVDYSFLLHDTGDREERTLEAIQELVSELETDFSKKVLNTKVNVILGEDQKVFKLNELIYSLLLIPVRFWSDEISEAANLEITFDNSFISNVKNVNDVLKDYFDVTIESLTSVVDVGEITKKIQYVIERVAHYSWHFNLVKGNSVNIFDILKAASVDPELMAILNFTSDENAQFSTIEDSVDEQAKRLIEILKSDKHDTCIKNMLSSVSTKQFQQAFVNISLKPDLYGKIIEKPINTSFLRGMRNSTDFFINATGARKALITNANEVRAAGYLSRKLALLVIGLELDRENLCDGSELLPIVVRNEAHAKRLTHRFFKTKLSDKKYKETTNYLSVVPYIGKTLYFASPQTCKLSGNRICTRCYGTMSELNRFHVALASMLKLTEQIIQMLLSSKHLLQVSTELVDLPDELVNYFSVDKNSVVVTKSCKVIITEYEQDPFTDDILVTALTLVDEEEDVNADIILSDITLSLASITSRLGDDMTAVTKVGEEAFRMNIENNELSAPLKKLLRLIESSVELNSKGGPAEVLDEVMQLLISSNIRLSSVGAEMLVRELSRDPLDPQKRATSLENTDFVRLTKAIVNSNAASISLVFQEYNKLLEGGLFSKTESAVTDYIF